MGVTVAHWHFETGERQLSHAGWDKKELEPVRRGWYCWVYTAEPTFKEWMEINCPSAQMTHRYNSGDPMFQIYIKEDQEATAFSLRWL